MRSSVRYRWLRALDLNLLLQSGLGISPTTSCNAVRIPGGVGTPKYLFLRDRGCPLGSTKLVKYFARSLLDRNSAFTLRCSRDARACLRGFASVSASRLRAGWCRTNACSENLSFS